MVGPNLITCVLESGELFLLPSDKDAVIEGSKRYSVKRISPASSSFENVGKGPGAKEFSGLRELVMAFG